MKSHEYYFNQAALQAQKATCLRDKCGAVIVLNDEIVGEGFNSPAGGEDSRKCHLELRNSTKVKSDRSCCMHAEWRAIIDGLVTTGNLSGSTLYFTRVDENGTIKKSGDPYCTVCSRFALDTGIAFFGLWQETGIKLFPTKEYNDLSYEFHQKSN